MKWRDTDWFFLALGLIALAMILFLNGCMQSTREATKDVQKQDSVTITGTVTLPTADGPKPLPIAVTIDRNGSEQHKEHAETKSGIDGAELGRQIAAAIGPLLSTATGGIPWAGIAQTAALAMSGVGTTYLAHQKRKQIKQQGQK